MRKDFATIALAIKRLGMRVAFISNGYMLNENTIKIRLNSGKIEERFEIKKLIVFEMK